MVNVGIIGAGRIGQVHMKSILTGVPNAKIVTIADPYIRDDVAANARSFGINVVSDYHEILNDPTIDAVLVCSSTDTHASISIEAIQAGKHIFCEKPVDVSLEKIDEVKAALDASEKPLKFQVGFNRRFDHNYHTMRNAVKDGKIGEVQFVRVSSRDPEPPSAEYAARSGGMVLDMMIHDLDMIHYLAGQEITEVYCCGACTVDPAIGEAGDVDTVTISVKFANGALGTIDGSRKAVYGYDQRGEVFGSKGCITSANDTNSTCVLSTVDGVTAEKPLWFFLERYMGSYQEEIRQFIDCVENDTEEPAGIEDGKLSIALAKACNISMKENRPVKMSEII